MARPLQHWDLQLRLEAGESEQALFVRIARAIADDIVRGRLRRGSRLPGSRALARSLAVHRNTVLAAFRELLNEGYLTARAGRGTFVAESLPDTLPRRFSRARDHAGVRARPAFELRPYPAAAPYYAPIPKGTLALYGGLCDLRLVPRAAFARAYRRALAHPHALGYGDPRGEPHLRAALATMLGASRGLSLGADDLVILRGSQMALWLSARLVLAPGDVVAVEAYGYRPAWRALRAAGARLVPIAVDRDGLCVDQLEELSTRQRVRALYLTPHHQYPTTATLSAARRLALLALAERTRMVVFEDDYDHEYHYEGRPILPLASADAAGSVVYIGTLSKVLAPGLRIGYVVAARELLERIARERFYVDRQGDHAQELALAELFEEGEIQRHVRRTRRIYQRRRDAFIELLGNAFGGELEWRTPPGGMALWTKIDRSIPVGAWLEEAEREGVLFHPGQLFDFEARALPYARFGFAALDESELEIAVQRLRRARRKLARVRPMQLTTRHKGSLRTGPLRA